MTTAKNDALDAGLTTRRQVLGDEWVDRSLARLNTLNADFQRMITAYAWDGIWNRPGLERVTRRMLVLSITAAMGRWEEFELHARTGLQADLGDPQAAPLTPEILTEVLLQVAVYAGVPAGNTGMAVVQKVLESMGRAPAPTTFNAA